MKKLAVVATESYLLDTQKVLPEYLTHNLYTFLSASHHIPDRMAFERNVIQPGVSGELTVLYGLHQKIAGFSRTLRHSMTIGKKQVTTFIAFLYFDAQYKTGPAITSSGLTEAIKYKLAHPQEELIYIAFANTPFTYELVYQLSDSMYPKPTQRVPDQIITVVNELKKQLGWISTNNHPMVVNSPLLPIRSKSPDLIRDSSDLTEFYLEANPDYKQGNSLLVYLPLHLANIRYGLNHVDLHDHQGRTHQQAGESRSDSMQ